MSCVIGCFRLALIGATGQTVGRAADGDVVKRSGVFAHGWHALKGAARIGLGIIDPHEAPRPGDSRGTGSGHWQHSRIGGAVQAGQGLSGEAPLAQAPRGDEDLS